MGRNDAIPGWGRAAFLAAFFLCLQPALSSGSSDPLWSAHIQPLLSRHCFKCHGELKQKNGLNLTAESLILKGGENGPAMVPGKPGESLLYQVVLPGAETHMPPKDYQLTSDELGLLGMWISGFDPGTAAAGKAPEWQSDYRLVQPNVPAREPPPGVAASPVIDHFIELEWSVKGVLPSRRTRQREFVRRVYVDLAGRIPTEAETVRFLALDRRSSREALVDQLLASPEYGRHMSEVFDLVLMGRAPKARDRRRDHKWPDYLRWAFETGRPWDRIVGDVLLARPENDEERPAAWYLYEREDDHQKIVEAMSPAILGVQIQCAQCHNHPLAPEIKQSHYWGLVSFFNRSKNAKSAGGIGVAESAIGGFVKFANLSKESQDATLTFFDGTMVPELRPGENEKEEDSPEKYRVPPDNPGKAVAVPAFSRREEFVKWATGANPLLARAFVNRIWALLLGRGLVHPVDMMDSAHPPSHPELLAWLARDFEQGGYDVRRLIKSIVLSRTYQLSSVPRDGQRPLPALFACGPEKPLHAEALLRSVRVALGNGPGGEGADPGFDDQIPVVAALFPGLFLEEYAFELRQALFLSNNKLLADLTAPRPGGVISTVLALDSDRQRVRELFRSILGRGPEAEERAAALEYFRGRETERAVRDLAWALICGSEFHFNH